MVATVVPTKATATCVSPRVYTESAEQTNRVGHLSWVVDLRVSEVERIVQSEPLRHRPARR